jgi:CDP-diacylglycerol--serine O-phosphatidyltransferase
MSEGPKPTRRDMPVVHLLPNMVTIAAICAGLTAIRFGFQGDFGRAVQLILLACVLDGVDGRLARLLKCESPMGAELDSLADFVNFGVAPALIIYVWALQDWSGAGWISILIFTICCVIRLARFNVGSKSETEIKDPNFFVGVPAPAGAMLVMLPMYVSFMFSVEPVLRPELMSLYAVLIGLLLISRIPTYSFKVMVISRENVRYVLIGFVVLVAALMTYLWTTLVVIVIAYIIGVLWALRGPRKA